MKFSLFHALRHFSIQKQLFIIYIPLIFLSALTVGMILIVDSTKLTTQNYKHLSELNAQRVKSIVFDTTNILYNTSTSLSSDIDLRKILSNKYESKQEFINAANSYKRIKEVRYLQTSISDIKIYTTNETIPNYTYFQQADESIQQTEWFQRAMNRRDAFFMTMPSEKQNSQLVLYSQLPLPLSDDEAVLEVKLDYNYLTNRLSNLSYDVELQLNQDALFYSDSINEVGAPAHFQADIPQTVTEYFTEFEDKRVLVAQNYLRTSNDSDIIYIYSVDDEAYYNLQANLIRWCIVLISVIIITLFIVFLFARFFANRIKRLQLAVYHATIEDYDFFQNISGEDEVSQISLDFHKIIQRIKRKEEEIYEARISEKELLNHQQQIEFNILAGQINPHFLFNTLETIRMMSLTSGNKEVAYAIKLLAKSMRNTLEVHGTKLTTLELALDAVNTYVEIQQMRFGDRVNFTMDIAENIDITKVKILPLLIQPIVENAISHGLERLTTKGLVTLSIKKEDSDIWIYVQDNGIGIPSDQLLSLQKKIESSSSHSKKSIGLQNVNHRAKITYGDKYGLTITSTKNTGTLVTLYIKEID